MRERERVPNIPTLPFGVLGNFFLLELHPRTSTGLRMIPNLLTSSSPLARGRLAHPRGLDFPWQCPTCGRGALVSPSWGPLYPSWGGVGDGS